MSLDVTLDVLRARGLAPLEHDLVATFEVQRGSFDIPADVLDDDHELRVYMARRLPPRDEDAPTETVWKRHGGGVTVTWRRVRVRMRRA